MKFTQVKFLFLCDENELYNSPLNSEILDELPDLMVLAI